MSLPWIEGCVRGAIAVRVENIVIDKMLNIYIYWPRNCPRRMGPAFAIIFIILLLFQYSNLEGSDIRVCRLSWCIEKMRWKTYDLPFILSGLLEGGVIGQAAAGRGGQAAAIGLHTVPVWLNSPPSIVKQSPQDTVRHWYSHNLNMEVMP